MSGRSVEGMMRDLFALWDEPGQAAATATPPAPSFVKFPPPAPARSLGDELGERLVSELLEGARAGRQGVLVTEPERLRTAIFLRGYSLGEFASIAGVAPATLSRALGGQTVAPATWRSLITTLARLPALGTG